MNAADLIARLETAESGSRDLDTEVFCLVHPDWSPWSQGAFPALKGMVGRDGELMTTPWLTRDVGEALSLIPRNLGVTFHRYLNMSGRSWACVHANYPEGTIRPVGTLARPEWTCSANSEALAICAAAVKMLFELSE